MATQTYSELTNQQRKEFSDFPIAYAFNDEQLKEALEKLGAKKAECVTFFGHGDIIKKVDVPELKVMLKRHKKELLDAMNDEDFAEAAFLYEMDNHEYAINWSGDEDVLSCFYMKDVDDLQEMNLVGAYKRARNQHMKNAREWDMI